MIKSVAIGPDRVRGSDSRPPSARWFAVCAALLAMACSGWLQRSPPSPKQIFERSVPSVVRVDVERGRGTGFVIDRAGLIATNLHVIDSTQSARVTFRDGRELPVTRVRAIDEAADLAIIEVAADDLPALLLGDSDAVAVGERIYAIGNPPGFDFSMGDGIIGGLRELQGVPSLQLSLPLSPGSSGGPILSERGQVVGVTRGFVPEAGALGIATPVKALQALRQVADTRPAQPFAQFASSRVERRQGGRERRIPKHPIAILEGCSDQDLRRSIEGVLEAIEAGAPAYNEGNIETCFRIYEKTALDVSAQLSPSCGGGRKALSDGLERAAGESEYDDKAWALRDAFDALLDVIDRRVRGGVQPARGSAQL